jgi:hypothetical protein
VRVPAREVLRAFQAVSGTDPNVAVSSRRVGTVLDPNLGSTASTRRYERLFGRFTVYVAARRDRVPAGEDLRWRRMPGNGWVAVKRYGANVVLSWTAPATGPTLDARWRRLDRMLGALPTG